MSSRFAGGRGHVVGGGVDNGFVDEHPVLRTNMHSPQTSNLAEEALFFFIGESPLVFKLRGHFRGDPLGVGQTFRGRAGEIADFFGVCRFTSSQFRGPDCIPDEACEHGPDDRAPYCDFPEHV